MGARSRLGTGGGRLGGLGTARPARLRWGGKLRSRRSSPPPRPGFLFTEAERLAVTAAEPLASLGAPVGTVLPRGAPAPARGPLGAGEAEAARGQSTRQAPRGI